MKCFVTGASGLLGANLVHELVAQGHEVKALLSDSPGLSSLANQRRHRPVQCCLAGEVERALTSRNGAEIRLWLDTLQWSGWRTSNCGDRTRVSSMA